MLILYIMILKLLEVVSRYYYKMYNIIESYSFIEKEIPFNALKDPYFFTKFFISTADIQLFLNNFYL